MLPEAWNWHTERRLIRHLRRYQEASRCVLATLSFAEHVLTDTGATGGIEVAK